jgi:hypothetical protein
MREIYFYARKNVHHIWQPLAAKSTIDARAEIERLADGRDMVEIGRSYKATQMPTVVFVRDANGKWELKVPRMRGYL